MSTLLGIYFGTIFASYLSTVVLILCKRSWGQLPHLYLRIIEFLQEQLQVNKEAYADSSSQQDRFIEKQHLTPELKGTDPKNSPFEYSNHLLATGIGSIVQDDISRAFYSAPVVGWTFLSFPTGNDVKFYFIYAASVLFRWGLLFPVRVLLLLTAMLWCVVFGSASATFYLPPKLVLYFGITFGRLFNAATGLISTFHDRENRPKAPGVAVANHMAANDIMIIYADCDYEGIGYTATGQLHGGFIQVVQKGSAGLTPTLWLDRASQKQREAFQRLVLDYSSNPSVYPVLLFPEGFCTNNDVVLQFRKAIFTGDVPIYPIAMQQNPRYGDSFWKEDTFIPYLLRVMTSFAVYYDVTYLPPMTRRQNEQQSEFAGRVQAAIAASIGRDAVPYDGGLKRAKDRETYKLKICDAIRQRLAVNAY